MLQAARDDLPAPTPLGVVSVLPIDRDRARQIAEARRLFNEAADDPWGNIKGRHRGDEATQARTHASGALGEAVVGRVLREAGDKRLRLAAPVEWVPSQDPDVVWSGETVLALDVKAADFRRADGRCSWTVNYETHHRAPVLGYIAADVSCADEREGGVARLFYFSKLAVELDGDLMERPSKSGEVSRFYRCFFPSCNVAT